MQICTEISLNSIWWIPKILISSGGSCGGTSGGDRCHGCGSYNGSSGDIDTYASHNTDDYIMIEILMKNTT